MKPLLTALLLVLLGAPAAFATTGHAIAPLGVVHAPFFFGASPCPSISKPLPLNPRPYRANCSTRNLPL